MKYIAITTTNSGFQRFNESYSGETLEDFKKRLQVNPEWKYGRFFKAKEIFNQNLAMLRLIAHLL